MESKFHALPPLKRFRLMHQETSPDSSCLPAKKRKESRSPPPFSTYCLPAKKRIWALQPNLILENPLSPFDPNLEYDPKIDEQQQQKQTPPKDVVELEPENNKAEGEELEEDDDGVLCAVCQSTDGDPSDPIVYCDGCDLMVHTTCYGHPLTNGVPEGDWFCSQCLTKDNTFSCCFCPFASGAMKLTNDGRWAHIVCALFVPEVFFCDPDGREGIDCSEVPPRRWGKKCYVCKSTNGCAIDCSEPKCNLGFHVTCGLKEDLCIEYREGKNKGSSIVAGFCKTHTELWKKQQGTGKFKIVADEHK